MSDNLDEDAIIGCLLGQAVGDMMGTPMENLSPRRIAKLFPKLDRPAFLFGRGMITDDTEHACMTAQALLRSGGDVNRFRRSLAWRLRWWLAAGPPGIGLATLKACVKLWLGFPSTRSGVYSAGNGPAMRSAILFVTDDVIERRYRELGLEVLPDMNNLPWFSDVTRITHTDRQALLGVFAVYAMVKFAIRERNQLLDVLGALSTCELLIIGDRDSDIIRNLAAMQAAYDSGKSVSEFAASLGLARGVTGYIAHTVPVAIYAFLRHPDDYRAAVESVIRCGGDTDTVAAITGALVGARVGKAGIPAEWLAGYAEWPRTVAWIERLGRELAKGEWRTTPQAAVPLAWWAIPFRNLFFFLVVLGHLFRRLLPPY